MPEVNACWCGDTTEKPFTADYLICPGCGSLRYAGAIELDRYTSNDGDDGFYGRRYWDEYVPDVLGLPGLSERARSDLDGRAVHYLQRILEYVGPGEAILEVGCAPGALAALADQAGFDVTGIELGDSVVERIRARFAIDVRPGPLERAGISQQFDAVLMIDVLEHLPRPLETLAACADRLRGDGILILQTPCYRGEGTDWPMLLPAEHLFLYSEQSVDGLLRAAGFHPVEIGTSLFPHDMWIVAAREPQPSRRPEPLAGVAPLALALIELSNSAERIASELEQAHADQDAKQSLIVMLTEDLEIIRADQAEKSDTIVELTNELTRVRRDQDAKEELIVELSKEIDSLRADQLAKESLILRISEELAAVRADQQAKEALIGRISGELEELYGSGRKPTAEVRTETPPPR